MAPSTGFEPVTYRLGGGCSILLSYEGEEGRRTLNGSLKEPKSQSGHPSW